MKLKNWDSLSEQEQVDFALKLLQSPRGNYLIAQALYHGMEAMKAVEPPIHREISNIEDMEMLSVLFEPYFAIFKQKAKP